MNDRVDRLIRSGLFYIPDSYTYGTEEALDEPTTKEGEMRDTGEGGRRPSMNPIRKTE